MKLATRVLSSVVLGASTLGVGVPLALAAPETRPTGVETAAVQTAVPATPVVLVAKPSSTMGTLAQGGFDRDHWWFKITKGEVVGIGVGVVCRAVFGGIGWFVCPPISAAVNQAVNSYPNAGGFWGELYTNGQVRAGTW